MTYVIDGYWYSGYGVNDVAPSVTSELQQVAPSSIIELFQLELNAAQHGVNFTYYFHSGTSLVSNGNLTFAATAYTKYPVEAEGFEYSGTGELPRPTLRISNVLSTMSALLLTVPFGLEGAKFTRLRTLARYIDAINFPGGVNPYGTPDPTALFPTEIFYVDRKVIENQQFVEFELITAFDLAGVRAPKRQCIANLCSWVYKSAECSYTGSLPTCDKNFNACFLHFGANVDLPFGGFPGVGNFV